MPQRVTVHHLTLPRRLPLIEEQGLRTRGELASALGGVTPIDEAARGKFAHGKRVSAWLDLDHARTTVDDHGAGHVEYDVDPRRAVAAPASVREQVSPEDYWAATRPLASWLAEDEVPDDLEVHVDRGIRAKYVRLRAPLFAEDDLGPWAALVDEVADEDRLSAKALMHLLIIESDADFDSPAFRAACALAWRDEQDDPDVVGELLELDPDKVASGALAMYGAGGEATARLREVLDETREWAEGNGVEHGQGLLMRTAVVLDQAEP